MNINKWPVIIFASPRTGSNALGYHIANLHNNTFYYSEPAMDFQFQNYAQQTKNKHVIKVIASHLINYPKESIEYIFSSNNFKIKLQRKNLKEQIASYYIAKVRNAWVYWQPSDKKLSQYEKFYHDFSKNEILTIDEDQIKMCIDDILKNNLIIDKLDVDLELCLEDFDYLNTQTKKTPRPCNYNELISTISKLL
jgi:hypothetical protein